MATKQRPFAPAAAGIVAAILVFLVLPNPLKVPQNNPTASAEYAPVPGRSDQNASGANFGETGLSNSAGVGTGGSGTGALPGFNDVPPPPQFVPRDKECVYVKGSAHQTSDPLSPPCVPFYQGDNGGNTYQGVTADEIKIALYNDNIEVSGDMNAPYSSSQEPQPPPGEPYVAVNIVRTIKSQLRYFQQRYQTYGRVVHVIARKSANGLATKCAQREDDAFNIQDELHPFAAVHLGDYGQCFMAKLAHDYKVPTFGLNSDVKRAKFEDNIPYVWGFFPDQESESQWSASFICRKLYNNGKQKARFTNDPLLNGKPRKFGFVKAEEAGRPELEELGIVLESELRRQCPSIFENENMVIRTYNAGGRAPGASEAPTIMNSFKSAGVTTIICYCVPVDQTVTAMQGAASSLGYSPEWYWDQASRMFRAIWQQTYGDPKQSSLGVSHHWRQPAYRQQLPYLSFKSVDHDAEPNAFMNFDIYHLFLNLFQAIQAAGPNLTPDSVQQGMFTFYYQQRDDPRVPTGGYGPYNSHAVSGYTFVDTAMGWWWDPNGVAPGDSNKGCLRLEDGGQRYYWNQWPAGDKDLFLQGQPCSPDDRKLAEAGGQL